jgi:uncharacterized protein YdaU (DUF1376 family)
MHSFLFHLGDYYAHTAHLSPIEDLAYRRLIDHYYLHQKPLTGSPAQLARAIRLRDNVDEVAQVLAEFFQESLDGEQDSLTSVWRNKRCDTEIERYKKMAEGGKSGANKRWSKGGDSTPIAPLSPPHQPLNANQEPLTINQEPLTNKKEKKKRAVALDCPPDVLQSTWEAFGALRDKKRAPITEVAIRKIRQEADKANVSLNEALEICCARGWQGFEASWLDKKTEKEKTLEKLYGKNRNKELNNVYEWEIDDERPSLL